MGRGGLRGSLVVKEVYLLLSTHFYLFIIIYVNILFLFLGLRAALPIF